MEDRDSNTRAIYMPLLDEGTDCVRPVPADEVAPDVYVVHPLRDEEMMNSERWLFAAGSTVRCRRESWGGQAVLVARELVPNDL